MTDENIKELSELIGKALVPVGSAFDLMVKLWFWTVFMSLLTWILILIIHTLVH